MGSLADKMKAKAAESKAPPMTKEEALEMMKQSLSHQTNLDMSIIVLIGAWKNGKTVCAASISDKFPDPFPNTEELTVLDDTWFFCVDPGALDGFAEMGITVPHSDVSVPKKTLREYEEDFDEKIEKVRPLVEAGVIKNVVLDSASFYDHNINAFLTKKYKNDKGGMWGEFRQLHTDRMHKLRSLGCRLVVCVHPTENVIWGKDGSEVQQKSKKRQMVSMLPGQADFKLDITGKSAGLYKGGGSWILPVIKETKKQPGKDPVDEYYIYLGGAKGIEGGVRLGKFLEKKQPANLGKLLKKLKECQPKLLSRVD